jgi:predicted DNA-binding protein
MKVLAKFKTMLNVAWEKETGGRKAFVFVNGFPGTFYLTQRRAIVVAEFTEKEGWLRKKSYHRLIFEAGLHELADFSVNLNPKERIFNGHIKFHAHNEIGEGAMIQFLKMDARIGRIIENHLNNLDIRKPVEDTGIVKIDRDAPHPQAWLKKRIGL